MTCNTDRPLVLQVSLVWPVIYLLFWAFLLVFSIYSEPVVCCVGLAIMFTGIPVYFLGVYWENKPQCFDVTIGKASSWFHPYLLDKTCQDLEVENVISTLRCKFASVHFKVNGRGVSRLRYTDVQFCCICQH